MIVALKSVLDLESVKFREQDGYLFGQGLGWECYRKLGAHPCRNGDTEGVYFAVWAPNARKVCVLTNVNDFQDGVHPMWPAPGGVGVWELFIPHVQPGDIYRYAVIGADGVRRYKSDPYAFQTELRPANASIVTAPDDYHWGDDTYMAARDGGTAQQRPMSIYEVHLSSWKRGPGNRYLDYHTLADQLVEYLRFMGYTHVELMGICEHPFDGSWGYQCTGYYAPTRRYGQPEDFRYLVDKLHQNGIGVILDWVPAHFSKDSHGLGKFDGTPLYEYTDPKRREMPWWGTYAFDHGKPEVRSFLISSAIFWIREYHIDGLRVDAVAAMLRNDFDGQPRNPNIYGGMENLEGMDFLRALNNGVHAHTDGFTIAEDSTAMPGITDDTIRLGMGFDFKWNMGWTFDTMQYFLKEPAHRRDGYLQLTNAYHYAFHENYVLPLSHDEVARKKGSLLKKMPGHMDEKRNTLKALYTLQMTSPGKKLLFMGQEFAQKREWQEYRQIDWELAEQPKHREVLLCVRNLLWLYRTYPCLYHDSRDERTFRWINRGDGDRGIVSYIRCNPWNYDGALLVIANLSPNAYPDYGCGVPLGGLYTLLFSTCICSENSRRIARISPFAAQYGEYDGQPFHISYGLRPYEAIILRFPG